VLASLVQSREAFVRDVEMASLRRIRAQRGGVFGTHCFGSVDGASIKF